MNSRIVRRVLVLVVVAGLVLAAVGCQPATTPTPTPKPTKVPEPTKVPPTKPPEVSVALIMIGPKDDNSWAEAAYTALQGLEGRGVPVAFSESVSDADVARVMREYVDEGYDAIIAHSFSYWDPVFEVAAESPEVNFAWAGGINETAANVGDYEQPFYEPAYLVGILAGYMSESGSLGALYGFDIPACHSMGEAMLAGAKTVNPDATLTAGAVGDWGDVAAAKEAALAQVDVSLAWTSGLAAVRAPHWAPSKPRRKSAATPLAT